MRGCKVWSAVCGEGAVQEVPGAPGKNLSDKNDYKPNNFTFDVKLNSHSQAFTERILARLYLQTQIVIYLMGSGIWSN